VQLGLSTLLYQMLQYFPWYVALVLAPMVIRILIERALGIRPEIFETRISPLPMINMSYETAFRTVTLTALYYPLFEELLFRGIPYLLFGTVGAVIGSVVWVLMHPAWQLQALSDFPLWKKIAFTVTAAFYYASSAAFYTMMWLDGDGLCAILYHTFHNGWITLADIIREVEIPTPWKRYRYVRKHPVSESYPKLFRKKGGEKTEEREEEEMKMSFVIRKSTKSLSDEVEEAKNLFVRRKVKNE